MFFLVSKSRREKDDNEIQTIVVQCFWFLEWNPNVSPKYAMVDYDNAEILDFETVFPNMLVYLCDFHREQAWYR